MNTDNFSPEQKEYLQGFFAGVGQRGFRFTDVQADPTLDDGTSASAGGGAAPAKKPKKLTKEEGIKQAEHPLDAYHRIRDLATGDKAPEGEDVFRFKWNGLFWLAPTKDGYMCRLRIPGGQITAHQFRSVSAIARDLASGFGQITTRSNLQVRVIKPADAPEVLRRLRACGLHSQGSGADNVRNITASPTAGIDPHELIDVAPLVDDLAMSIMGSREYSDLPRKFNIALDGGGTISCAEDTNDIGLRALEVREPLGGHAAGVWFQLLLGGITGHQHFAEDTGVLVPADQAVDVCLAALRVFIKNGNRSNRGKARLIYLLKDWGFEKFLAETEKELGHPLVRADVAAMVEAGAAVLPSPPKLPLPQYGVREQKQPGLRSIGVETPVGVVPCDQMDALADIAEGFGSGRMRLTVFQNVVLCDIPEEKSADAVAALEAAGLRATSSNVAGGLVACTGNRYCKYANVDTKGKGIDLVRFLEQHIELDQPINIHVTGCPHSCAQHYIGDLGLLGAKVERGGEAVEGFHVFVGGGFGPENKALGRMLFKGVAAGPETNDRILALLQLYTEERAGDAETFQQWSLRQENIDELAARVEGRLAGSEPEPVGA